MVLRLLVVYKQMVRPVTMVPEHGTSRSQGVDMVIRIV